MLRNILSLRTKLSVSPAPSRIALRRRALLPLLALAGMSSAAASAAGDAGLTPKKYVASTFDAVKAPRTVTKVVAAVEQSEGQGARVRRSIGRPELRNLDPFLMLDHFNVKLPANFADHPHRGFETSTFMLEGAFEHQDFAGHRGLIAAGDLQWMTPGRGIVHAEIPAPHGVGLQLWINLAAKDKMIEPAYQELKGADIPHVATPDDGVTATVIAGTAYGVSSPVRTRTPVYYLEFKMKPGAVLAQALPAGWNAFLYVISGAATFGMKRPGGPSAVVAVGADGASAAAQPVAGEFTGGTHSEAFHTLVLSAGEAQDGVVVKADADKPVHFVLLAGQPLNEPVAQMGPFVMNTQEQLRKAIEDYRGFRNGFERARGWESDFVRGQRTLYGRGRGDEDSDE